MRGEIFDGINGISYGINGIFLTGKHEGMKTGKGRRVRESESAMRESMGKKVKGKSKKAGIFILTISVEHPGVFAAAALGGVDDERAFFQGDAGESSGHDVDFVSE